MRELFLRSPEGGSGNGKISAKESKTSRLKAFVEEYGDLAREGILVRKPGEPLLTRLGVHVLTDAGIEPDSESTMTRIGKMFGYLVYTMDPESGAKFSREQMIEVVGLESHEVDPFCHAIEHCLRS